MIIREMMYGAQVISFHPTSPCRGLFHNNDMLMLSFTYMWLPVAHQQTRFNRVNIYCICTDIFNNCCHFTELALFNNAGMSLADKG